MNIIGLLRHGPTAWNRDKRIQGSEDIPLDTAAFQATAWRQLLHQYGPWDQVVSSSLSRCRQTCDILLPGQPYGIDRDLREQDWGLWTGQTIGHLRLTYPGRIEAEERLGWEFTPPGGESRRAVLLRVRAAIGRATADRDGLRILLVTHLGVIKILLNHLENTPFLPDHSTPVGKRGLHLLRQDGADLTILQTNIEGK